MTNPEEIESRALSIPDEAMIIEILNHEDLEKAGRILLKIKEIRMEIDHTFDPIISKAHESHREAISQKRRIEDPLVRAENMLKPKMSSFIQDEESRRRTEENKANEDLPMNVPPVIIPMNKKVEGISTRKIWKFEVVNPDLVPLQFKIVDEVKINKYLHAMGDQTHIPGVRIWQETSIAARKSWA